MPCFNKNGIQKPEPVLKNERNKIFKIFMYLIFLNYLKPRYLWLIFWNTFCFMHIPFGAMVQFESLAQFPEDILSFPVMPHLVFLLC